MERIVPLTGPLADRRLLVVGAGRMAHLVAMSGARHGARIVISNRSPERAAALAQQAGGDTIAFGSMPDPGEVDAVVLAIGGGWPLAPAVRDGLLRSRIPVVDLSSPPAVGPDLRELLGVRYTSIDDLARGPHHALRARLARRYERAIEDSAVSFERWYQGRSAVPAIQALNELAEERRNDELERLFRRLELDDHERELVVQMSHRLVSGLLHAPLVSLRDDTSGELEHAARTLFSL
jgi:glutamyl-tRNA reductase